MDERRIYKRKEVLRVRSQKVEEWEQMEGREVEKRYSEVQEEEEKVNMRGRSRRALSKEEEECEWLTEEEKLGEEE